jgi:hypothetical protein
MRAANTTTKTPSVLWVCMFLLAMTCFVPSVVSAQNESHPNVVLDIAKSVLFDPTTYVPAGLSYDSQRIDWNTSQPLFKMGWLEQNPRFTVSGRPDDTPLSYRAGNREIRHDALMFLQESVVNNLSAHILERTLTQKYPEHRKLFKTLSWVERISFSGYVGYLASVDHFRQAQKNREMARQHGIQ